MSSSLTRTSCAVLFCCATALAQQNQSSGNIVGQISIAGRGYLNQPVLVKVETRGMVVSESYTDNEGRFSADDLVANPYQISINEKEYEPVRITVSLDPAVSRTVMISIRLVPKNPTAPGPDTRKGSNPFMVNTADLSHHYPKPMVKAYEEGIKADSEARFDKAITHYKKALEIAPNFYPARNNLGSDYLAMGDSAAAYEQFHRVISENQADATSYFNLANLFLLTQRYAEASTSLQEGFRRQPNSAFGRFVEGALYSRTNKPREAERALQSALQLDSSMGKVHLELVNLYLREHNEPAALFELKEFTAKFPKDPLAAKAQQLSRKLEDGGVKPLTR